jgi:hypothetical protein
MPDTWNKTGKNTYRQNMFQAGDEKIQQPLFVEIIPILLANVCVII